MKIAFIGAGNVARHLAVAFESAGHQITEIYSRDANHSRWLASMLYDVRLSPDLNFDESPAELFVLAVPDDAMEEVVRQLVLPENAILVHTSGSKTLNELEKWVEIYSDVPVRTGVFYPLQTFSKETPALSFESLPLCIEASDKDTEEILVKLGQQMSRIVYLVSSQERRVLHVAAVFACNFTNYLLGVAKDITDAENLEFDLLKPLIRETIRKALSAEHPAQVQTGPARRGDLDTLALHLEYLTDKPELLELYQLLTDSIQKSEPGLRRVPDSL
ncbi:Rossmann-like and DUF2520 domain-containing protein [Tellurirhabdus rosea]|uniref:Rossmann-like and DUF2520 domain-containing protein n=1 Tax=Tellurirhabdus rosea TaxID=2674997 RepID=UPI00225C3376|nr:Rossmann-like and DUF2520 domain-containing protein [Tellurirhabdus rosea]